MTIHEQQSETQQEAKLFFSRFLLEWYQGQKRDLPWRRHRNPYYIWISEIMLQQTRVDTVIPYFNRFIERFPTVESLADAPEEEVLKCWEGLGYYSRARNLQHAAKQVKEQYGGQVPNDRDAVFGLKGVGPYTAGAILSIAFNRPEPAVDGNVMRVLSRYFLIEDDIAKGPTRVAMERLAAELIPEGEASHFNQALMELGALVCTPKSPRCLPCPVMEHCAARLAGCETSLPVKTKAKPPRPEERLAALVEGRGEHAGRVLIRQRPVSGLLARMWELPHWPAPPAEGGRGGALLPEAAALDRLRRSLRQAGIPARPEEHWMAAEHTFSHIVWTLQVYRCREEDVRALPVAAEGRAAYAAGQSPGAGDAGRPAGAGGPQDSAATGISGAGLPAADKDAPALNADAGSSAALAPGSATPDLFSAAGTSNGQPAVDGGSIEPFADGNGNPSLFSAAGTSNGQPAVDGGTIEPFADGNGNPEDGGAVRWINREEMANYAFPNVFLKLLNSYFDEQNG
ncbi:A/G-specific adenine glycosylase [Paenibacillus riograndensis SBR5]|uniref:Adenine DNA glycosylase n=1 Tax=Paenibacillus riograndensis SBR5 TaxID=1073571 RepID=A0A0E4CUJ6_9BACL|nr:A/G-specific adenine glycosylase [Paenibacillus riograndensis SBR5]